MFCDEALEAIEPIASGELTPRGRIAEHLATCPNCAATLERARRLDRLLRSRPVPAAPPQFTPRTLARVRRERWRNDQFLDVGFNLAIAVVVVGVVAAVWLAMNFSGFTAVGGQAVGLFGTGITTLGRRLAPALPLYAGAMLLLIAALAVWWWAERDTAY